MVFRQSVRFISTFLGLELHAHGQLHRSGSAGAVQLIHTASERLIRHLGRYSKVGAGHVSPFKLRRIGEVRMVEYVVSLRGNIELHSPGDWNGAAQREIQLPE